MTDNDKEKGAPQTNDEEVDLVLIAENDESVKEFKAEYKRRGNTDLLYQVDYLSKFAGRYQEKDDWASLLRAHALYNSCAVRDTENRERWLERACQVQVKYWQEDLQSFPQHLQVTQALKCQLKEIRDKGRKETDRLAEQFKDLICEPGQLNCHRNQEIYEQILQNTAQLSRGVNDDMIQFTRTVVEQALGICGHPVCKYCVVALGSMSRGEMTPFSDLEFLFLITSKSTEAIQYFQRLAVTIYFLIGNLCETKLKVMAIPELLGWDLTKEKLFHWFDDSCMSGFKIDGLGSWAGNIPTGGTPGQYNQFICTVEELAESHKSELDKPDPEKSLKGDLTAMLANTAFIAGDQNLHDTFRSLICSRHSNERRKTANMKMLSSDAKMYDFRPNAELTHTRQLKPDVYRYPSILVLNLKLLHGVQSCDPWEIIGLLESEGHISGLTARCLRISFCCALIIRLSAYFYHNSQSDAISVLSQREDDNMYQGAWYIQPQLLVHMFMNLVPLKAAVSEIGCDPSQMIQVEVTNISTLETVAMVRYYCTEYAKALSLLKEAHPDGLGSADPFMQQIFIHSAIECNDYAGASSLLEIRNGGQGWNDHDLYLLGRLYDDQCLYSKALDSYQTRLDTLINIHGITDHLNIARSYCDIGTVLRNQSKYTEALVEFKKGLCMYLRIFGDKDRAVVANVLSNIGVVLENQSRYNEALAEYRKCFHMFVRLYGDRDHVHIAAVLCNIGVTLRNQSKYTEALVEYRKCLDMRLRMYGDRDHVKVASVLCNIGAVLIQQTRYTEALAEFKKSLGMYQRIYGEANHVNLANVLCEIGTIFTQQSKYAEALVQYRKCLDMYVQIYEGKDHVHIANMLCNIGGLLHGQRKYSEAMAEFRSCLDMRKRLHGGRDHIDIADVLCNMGAILDHQHQYSDALEACRKSLDMYARIHGDGDHLSVAQVRCNMGVVLKNQGKYTDALEEYETCLGMYVRIYGTGDNVLIAKLLSNIGVVLQHQTKYTEALVEYEKCLDMYRRLYGAKGHVDIAQVHVNIALVLRKQSRYTEALTEYNRSLDIYMKIFGDTDHPSVAFVRSNIGLVTMMASMTWSEPEN